jgi:hypothetical protein
MFEYFDMSKYDIDIEGYRCGDLRILIEDWNGPFAELGEQVNNSNIRMSLKGWIDDPEVNPMGDIYEGHADSIYSFKPVRINVVLNEERKWPFQIPSEVAENLPSVRGVGKIYAEEEHALHESLDEIAIFYLSVPQDYWDVLLQGLQITHARKRFQSWEIRYLIPETSLNPDEKDSWFGWGSKWGRVRPRHFDTTKTMVLGVFSFGFSNTILPIEQVDKIPNIKPLSTTGKETERVRIKITTLVKQFSSYSGQVEYRKLKGKIGRNSKNPFSAPKYVGEAEVELELHDENNTLWLPESEKDTDKKEDGFKHGYYQYFTDREGEGEAKEHGNLSLTIYVNQFQLDKYFEKIRGNLVFLEVTLDLVDWEGSSSGIVYNYSLTEISDTDSFERFPIQEVGQSISESVPKALSREELLEIKQSVEQLSKDVINKQDEIESTLRNLLQTTRAADELRYDLNKKFRILLALIVLTVLIQIFSN